MNINFDYSKAVKFLDGDEISNQSEFIKQAHNMLHEGTGAGSDFLGWVNLPFCYDKAEYAKIKAAAAKIQSDSEVLVVIGIGGSYLGSRAVIEALNGVFYNFMSGSDLKYPKIVFVGNNMSASYMNDLLKFIEGKDVSLNVISKSGTTTEPAIAFRILKEYMENVYGKTEAAKRIYATTDKSRGALKKLADEEGYQTFVIPDDVGGRYSVLTPVGLLPIAAAGGDIDALMNGAADAAKTYSEPNVANNECYQYAAARNALYRKGITTEIIVNYEPALHYISEWWKQLYGESEGKNNKGIFPAGVDFSADLHSMGQYIQEGLRNIFETAIIVRGSDSKQIIRANEANLDGLNFLAGMDMNEINYKAFQGTLLAHTDGGVPNFTLFIDKINEYCLGNLIYFFEKACGISGYLLGVNPFNQPGVEAYKKNMFALLGKPGYEEMKSKLEARL